MMSRVNICGRDRARLGDLVIAISFDRGGQLVHLCWWNSDRRYLVADEVGNSMLGTSSEISATSPTGYRTCVTGEFGTAPLASTGAFD